MSLVAAGGYGLLAAAATAVVWKGSQWLESSSARLSSYYGLPPIVQGAVVAAVGSSFPELSSAVLSTLIHGEFTLGVGAIVGSAIFNILVIPGVATLAADGLDANRDLAYKEALFYMLSVSVLVLTFALAVIYNPDPGRLAGTVTPALAALPVGLYVLYLFIQVQDTADHAATPDEDVAVAKQWGMLAVSLVVIVIAVEGMVRAALGLGRILDTPSFVWGLTVVAAGTSLPDAFVSVRQARTGRGVASLANVLGSNTFDLLIAIPAGVIMAGGALVDFASAVPMMGLLTLATIVLFAGLRTKLRLTEREAVALLAAYVGFVGWILVEAADLVDVLPGV